MLVLDLKAVDVAPAEVATLQVFVTTGLSQYPELDIISGDDVKNLVSLQAERTSAGCSDDASCLADIADALGAQLVVFGNCGRLDNALVINLNLFDSTKALSLGRVVVQADTAKALAKKLRPKLHELVGRFYRDRGLTLPELAPEPEEPPPVQAAPYDPGAWPWIVTGSGAVLAVGGAIAAMVGYLPMATFQDAKADVLAREAQFNGDEDVAHIASARASQESLRDAREQWNGFGVYAFDIGVAAAAAGLALTGAGVIWALSSPGAAPPPDEAAPPPTDPGVPLASNTGGAR